MKITDCHTYATIQLMECNINQRRGLNSAKPSTKAMPKEPKPFAASTKESTRKTSNSPKSTRP